MARKQKNSPKQIKLTSQEAGELLSRIHEQKITSNDLEIFESTLVTVLWLQKQLSRARLSIKRLKKLFGFKSEARTSGQKPNDDTQANNSTTPAENDSGDDADQANNTTDDDTAHTDNNTTGADTTPKSPSTDNADNSNAPENKKEAKFDPTKNHGRYSATDYTGCQVIDVPLDESFDNCLCPLCLAANTKAKLYSVPPSVVVVLHGSPIVTGAQYRLQRMRCSVCQTYFTAELPDGVDAKKRYTPSCISSIAINHYGGGLPFKRLESLQYYQGIPLPDATQFELVKGCYESVISPVVKILRYCAAQSKLINYDDTTGRIIEQQLSKKGAVHATALLGDYQGHKICLFDTNEQTAGQSLKQLLTQRDTDESFMSMSDASKSNFSIDDERLLIKWIICLCLAHSRRRFVELVEEGADDIAFILAVIGRVYHHDRYCKKNALTIEERLIYHQKHSAPLMEALRIWLNNQLLYKTVEPNSHLGEAIVYLLKHWQGLTQFLRVAGAPLDNNLCEQAVKVFIRYRKNSLFYRTFYGATIGDAMMSVFHTCASNNVNVFDYMNTLQAHVKQVNAAPQDWLPWCYKQTVANLSMALDSS